MGEPVLPVFDAPRHRRPLPIPTAFTEPFWEGTRIGELRVQRCNACGHWRWTPQIACPRCLSEDAEWRADRCRQAQERLSRYRQSAALYEQQDDGGRRYYSDEETANLREQAQREANELCDD